MTQYIRFTKTSKDDVTVGKLYMIDTDDDGMHHFEDDDGAIRSVKRNGKLNKFMIIDVDDVFAEAYNSTFDEQQADELDDEYLGDLIRAIEEDGADENWEQDCSPDNPFVIFYFTDGDDICFHDVERVDVEERGHACIAIVLMTNRARRIVPMANVRHMYMSGLR